MHEARLATARQDLSRNVRTLRKATRLTLKVAAGRAAIHWRHWQKIEAGETNPTLETLAKVAGALNAEVVALFLPPLK